MKWNPSIRHTPEKPIAVLPEEALYHCTYFPTALIDSSALSSDPCQRKVGSSPYYLTSGNVTSIEFITPRTACCVRTGGNRFVISLGRYQGHSSTVFFTIPYKRPIGAPTILWRSTVAVTPYSPTPKLSMDLITLPTLVPEPQTARTPTAHRDLAMPEARRCPLFVLNVVFSQQVKTPPCDRGLRSPLLD